MIVKPESLQLLKQLLSKIPERIISGNDVVFEASSGILFSWATDGLSRFQLELGPFREGEGWSGSLPRKPFQTWLGFIPEGDGVEVEWEEKSIRFGKQTFFLSQVLARSEWPKEWSLIDFEGFCGAVLPALGYVCEEQTYPYLQGVAVTPSSVIATDVRRMYVCRFESPFLGPCLLGRDSLPLLGYHQGGIGYHLSESSLFFKSSKLFTEHPLRRDRFPDSLVALVDKEGGTSFRVNRSGLVGALGRSLYYLTGILHTPVTLKVGNGAVNVGLSGEGGFSAEDIKIIGEAEDEARFECEVLIQVLQDVRSSEVEVRSSPGTLAPWYFVDGERMYLVSQLKD